jgi:hypothetical protein
MKMRAVLILLLAMGIAVAVVAYAQTSGAPYIVSSCGSVTLKAGTYATLTEDRTGKLCTG